MRLTQINQRKKIIENLLNEIDNKTAMIKDLNSLLSLHNSKGDKDRYQRNYFLVVGEIKTLHQRIEVERIEIDLLKLKINLI